MCMAETRIIPSRMPLFLRAASTSRVILTYSRCRFVLKVRYSVWNFIRPLQGEPEEPAEKPQISQIRRPPLPLPPPHPGGTRGEGSGGGGICVICGCYVSSGGSIR